MAVVTGGVTGRPAGKLAGVVFGAARSRTGKVVTAREKVRPSNPDSAAQQVQRRNFARAIQSVRGIGPSEYSVYWNRSVGQLPGFQSLMSILLGVTNETGDLSAPPDTPLGDLHYPDNVTFSPGDATGRVEVTFSGETGSNGTADDIVHFYAIPAEAADRDASAPVGVATFQTRIGVNAQITDMIPGAQYLCVMFLEGQGTAEGKLSRASWGLTTAAV